MSKRCVLLPTRRMGLDYPSTLVGATADVEVYVGTALGAAGTTLAKECLREVEKSFQAIQGYFGGLKVPKLQMYLAPLSAAHDGTGGAYHYGCTSTQLYCDAVLSPMNPALSLALFAAEAVEVFEGTQGLGWDCGASNGEGLSRVLAEAVQPGVLDGFETASAWLDSTDRPNWVDKTEPTDQNAVSTGCAVLFLTWMRTALGHTWAQIATAGSPTLAGTYKAITGKSTAWSDFEAAVQAKWPAGTSSGVSSDDPW